MPTGHPIDLNALHRYLYRRTDRLGRLRIVQKKLADELGYSRFNVSRVLKRMEAQQRIRKVGDRERNTYVIVQDPDVWCVSHPDLSEDWL